MCIPSASTARQFRGGGGPRYSRPIGYAGHGGGKHPTDCRGEFRQRQGCALDRLRETSRSSGAGVIVSHDERGNIAVTPSPSLAGIIIELGTSRFAIVGR